MSTALPDDLASRPFSVAEALRRGVSAGRLELADLRADYHGTRVPRGTGSDVESLCRAYATRLGAQRYFSHATAAVLWGMRLPTRLEWSRTLHVTSIRPTRAPRTHGVVGHHVDPPGHELVAHRGFVVPTPAETWRQLSTCLDLEELVVAGDGLVGRSGALVSLAQLRRSLARHAGRRGNATLRCAFEKVREGTDSARETRTRLAIVAAGLPEPTVNPVVSRDGERRRLGDLAYVEWRVLVEYEGIHHQSSRAAYLADIARFEQLERAGWRIVRITKEDTPATIASRVRAALRAAGAPV